jgi:hypothetical protein
MLSYSSLNITNESDVPLSASSHIMQNIDARDENFLERFWNAKSHSFTAEVISMESAESKPITLSLKVKPATTSQDWVALVESEESDSQIRFQDLSTLMRYIQALCNSQPAKGLR